MVESGLVEEVMSLLDRATGKTWCRCGNRLQGNDRVLRRWMHLRGNHL